MYCYSAIQIGSVTLDTIHGSKNKVVWSFFDLSYLFQVHYFVEPFCVSLKRTLPAMHPLNQIMKYHCRETIVPTTLGTPILLGDKGFADLLFAYGNDGAIKLVHDIHPLTSWEVTDFRKNVKVCGNVLPWAYQQGFEGLQ